MPQRSTVWWAAVAACVVAAIGSFGPWVTAFGGAIEKAGTAGDGVITLVAALIALGCLIPARPGLARVAVGLGVIVVIIAIVDLSDVKNKIDAANVGNFVSAGWGLYVTLIGGVALVIAAFLSAREASRAQPSVAPAKVPPPSPQ